MALEWVDHVDEDDQVIGRVTRRQMRAQNLLHRNIAVMCEDSGGLVYVHRRTETKDLFPGLYDVFVGGVVSAGEDYDACAQRELAEELGIEGPTPERLFMFRFESEHTRSFTAVYRVVWDGPIVHQASEVAFGTFRSVSEILANSEGWTFVPDGWAIFLHHLRGGV
jgi:8-oxo-dGTP pyrophosphatase MutT (NUDIX family)